MHILSLEQLQSVKEVWYRDVSGNQYFRLPCRQDGKSADMQQSKLQMLG